MSSHLSHTVKVVNVDRFIFHTRANLFGPYLLLLPYTQKFILKLIIQNLKKYLNKITSATQLVPLSPSKLKN